MSKQPTEPRASADDELAARLWAGVPVQALLAEREAASIFEKAEWTVIHGCHYIDVETRKIREVDVVARRTWGVEHPAAPIIVRLKVVVEVKTLRESHIVVSAEQQHRPSPTRAMWLGHTEALLERAKDTVRPETRFDGRDQGVTEAIREAAFPGGTPRIDSALVAPPKPEAHASALRETTVGGERDPDRSVLWNAARETWSALASMMGQFTDDLLAELRRETDEARKQNRWLAFTDPAALARHFGQIDIYHPVVVVDSQLWSAEVARVVPINSFRMQQVDSNGEARQWCDVVRRSYFATYVHELGAFYDRRLGKKGERLD